MLCLRRTVGETIVIDHRIRVVVMEVGGKFVRLGIEAPQDIAVHRGEIEEALRKKEAKDG